MPLAKRLGRVIYCANPRQISRRATRERQQRALDWARQQKLAYVVTGSVEEWQYKNGLDGEPAVGVSLQVLEPASGRVLWSTSGARAGWSRESLAGAAQKVLRELVGDLRLE